MRSFSVVGGASSRGARVRRRLAVVAAAALGLSVLLAPGVATADPLGPVGAPASSSDLARPKPSASLAREVSRVERQIASVLRSSPGAVRTGPFEVSWDGGAVVSTWALPASAPDLVDASAGRAGSDPLGVRVSASGYAGCPDGTSVHWFCFYEHAGYGGRMLQFRDCPSTQSLASYGFANQTTAWVNNRSGVTVSVYDGSTVLWREYGRSHSSNVGSWANDRAVWFTCR